MSGALDEAGEFRAGEELDVEALGRWLRASFPEIRGSIEVTQFHGGHSNLTYLVAMGGTQMVLRRPAAGDPMRGGRDLRREFDVLSKLSKVYPLAPRPLCRCDDAAVLGVPFFLMEHRQGLVLRRKLPRGFTLDTATARRLSEVFIDTLARLHSLDYASTGLGDLGTPEGYAERQVRGWIHRYHRAAVHRSDEIDDVARWLEAEIPPAGAPAFIHNDYKYDNLLLDPGDPARVVAVLDWEMATVGDSLMDLGTALAYWQQGDDPMYRMLAVGPTHVPGSLTRRELVERYALTTRRTIEHVVYYYVFGLFKITVITQQLQGRYQRGDSTDPRLTQLGAHIKLLARTAAEAAGSGRY